MHIRPSGSILLEVSEKFYKTALIHDSEWKLKQRSYLFFYRETQIIATKINGERERDVKSSQADDNDR
jgi:hypothetical protein